MLLRRSGKARRRRSGTLLWAAFFGALLSQVMWMSQGPGPIRPVPQSGGDGSPGQPLIGTASVSLEGARCTWDTDCADGLFCAGSPLHGALGHDADSMGRGILDPRSARAQHGPAWERLRSALIDEARVYPGLCRARGRLGDSCGCARECADGLICNFGFDSPRCLEPGSEGAVCFKATDCAPDYHCSLRTSPGRCQRTERPLTDR